MSKIGKKLINIPDNVAISVEQNQVVVKNNVAALQVPLFKGIKIKQEKNQLEVLCESSAFKSWHGLVRSLIFNSIIGITEGFEKKLVLKGVGFKAVKKGDILHLSIGFSHEVKYKIPSDVKLDIIDTTKITIKGIDKQRVGQVVADIKSFKKMDPYKGKGIFLEGEKIKRKAGKSAKK